MTPNTSARRSRYASFGLPAAFLGALAGALVAAPADAATDASNSSRSTALPLRIAPAEAPPSDYVVAPGDTVWAIAARYGLRTSDVLAANGLDAASVIQPGQHLALAPAAPASTTNIHTVVAGDTLFAIAQRHGITLDALLGANGLDRSSIIYPGQTLSIAPQAAAPAPAPATVPAGQRMADLDAEQAANAALIIRIGRELGVSDRGIAIALATGMVESGLRNLAWGDRDSLGIFQQRPSTGWGSPAQIQDADRSTRVFYGGAGDPNGQTTRGLLDIPGWDTMAFTDAAQAVQISAYPLRYGEWETAAHRWLELYR